MMEIALIGSENPLGRAWAASRIFDYLAGDADPAFPHNKQFSLVGLIDPALWKAPFLIRGNNAAAEEAAMDTRKLLRRIPDLKTDRFVFVTTADLLPEDGHEKSEIIEPGHDEYLAFRSELYHLVNSQFGRVLTIFIPELAVADPAFSVLGLLQAPPQKGKLPLSPLERHQLYPPGRLDSDIRRLFSLGVSRFVAAMPALTSAELVSQLAPELAPLLPDFTADDPLGSNRTSLLAFHWLDSKSGHLVTRDTQIAQLRALLAADAL
ncbi:MAG: hypothetical protein LUG84_07455 [Akkermansiaceae bacterium]|nr:hypothetical protein [Akkermansiaceae bacterium]